MVFRRLTIGLEFSRFDGIEEAVADTARDFGFPHMAARSYGETLVSLRYRVGRNRKKAERMADEISRYFYETGLSCSVYLWPSLPAWLADLRSASYLALWTLRHPHQREESICLIRWQLSEFLREISPFRRCECGKFTRLFWRHRDPHFRNGQWIGPDDCLPF